MLYNCYTCKKVLFEISVISWLFLVHFVYLQGKKSAEYGRKCCLTLPTKLSACSTDLVTTVTWNLFHCIFLLLCDAEAPTIQRRN